jgi:hypothetical protein
MANILKTNVNPLDLTILPLTGFGLRGVVLHAEP